MIRTIKHLSICVGQLPLHIQNAKHLSDLQRNNYLDI